MRAPRFIDIAAVREPAEWPVCDRLFAFLAEIITSARWWRR